MDLRIIVVMLAFAALSSGLWTFKKPLNIRRSDHTASTVGNTIIVAGGCIGNQTCEGEFCICTGFTNSTESYDPVANTWTVLPAMPRIRARHAAAVVSNKLYVFGGRNQADDLIPEVDVYDPTSNAWTTLPTSWAAATSDLGAFVFNNTIYAAGGYDASYGSRRSVYSFQPLSQNATWTLLTKSMNLSRGDMCISVVGTKAYVVGGFKGDDFCTPLNMLEIYDSSSDSWVLGVPMKHSRGDKACGTLHNKFHVIGGEKKDANCSKYHVLDPDVEVYDPSTQSFVDETPLAQGRFRFAAATLNDVLYITGGQGPIEAGGYFPVLSEVQAYTEPAPTSSATTTAPTSAPATAAPTTAPTSAPQTSGAHAILSSSLLFLAMMLL